MAGDRQRFDKVMNQGHSAVWDQSWEKAASYYRQALDEFPEDAKALTSLALALFELGDYKGSLLNYQRAVKVIPDDPIPMEKIASLLERLGRADQAIDAYMRSAELYVKNREVNKSIEIWQHVIGLNAEYPMAHSRLGLIYERLDRKAEAVNEYLAIASLFQHAGDIQKATQAVTHALQILPGSSEAGQALNMIKMGRLLPRPAQTRRPLDFATKVEVQKPVQPAREQAANQDPVAATRQKAISSLASLLFDSMAGESTTSAGFQSIMRGGGSSTSGGQVDTTRVMVHLSQVIDAISRREDNQAIEELTQALDAGLDHPSAYYLLGMLLDQAGRLESAVRNLQRAAQTPDLAMGANLLMGQILLKLGRGAEAAAVLLEALKYADLQTVP